MQQTSITRHCSAPTVFTHPVGPVLQAGMKMKTQTVEILSIDWHILRRFWIKNASNVCSFYCPTVSHTRFFLLHNAPTPLLLLTPSQLINALILQQKLLFASLFRFSIHFFFVFSTFFITYIIEAWLVSSGTFLVFVATQQVTHHGWDKS